MGDIDKIGLVHSLESRLFNYNLPYFLFEITKVPKKDICWRIIHVVCLILYWSKHNTHSWNVTPVVDFKHIFPFMQLNLEKHFLSIFLFMHRIHGTFFPYMNETVFIVWRMFSYDIFVVASHVLGWCLNISLIST